MKNTIERLDVGAQPWKVLGTHGLRAKPLNVDPDSGARTAYVGIPAAWKGGGVAHFHDFFEEVFVIQGDVSLDGRNFLGDGAYIYRPAGIVHGHDEGAILGCRALIRSGGPLELKLVWQPIAPHEYVLHPHDDGRPFILGLETAKLPWREEGTGGARRSVKTLSVDAKTGAATTLVRLPQSWPGSWALAADASWEWFVLSGSVTLGDGATHGAGTYSFRPPGLPPTFLSSATGGELILWRGP